MAPMDANTRLEGTSYILRHKLGVGGMGTVWAAEHVELGRVDAVKLLGAQVLDNPDAFERLKREARATAQLGNPNIIDIYTLGVTTDGQPYVAMRLVQGPSLRQAIAKTPTRGIVPAWEFMRPVCAALQDAHDARIVHRDLKPENIMVESRRGEAFPVILDFGIAKSLLESDPKITREGDVVGTPGYMAPEQALGRAVDGRADQYSVAVMLYELVSAQLPVERGTALQMVAQQITQPARGLRGFVTEEVVPDSSVAVLMRALDRDPSQRYATMDDFIAAMDASLEGLWSPARGTYELSGAVAGRATAFQALATTAGPSAPATPPAALEVPAETPRRSRLALVAGTVAVLAGAGVAWGLMSAPEPQPLAPAAATTVIPATTVAPATTVTPETSAPASTAAPVTVAPVTAAPASAEPNRVAPASEPARPRVVVSSAPTAATVAPTAAPTVAPTTTPVAAVAAIATAPPTTAPAPVTQAAPARLVASTQVQGGASSAELKTALGKVERQAQACVAALGPLQAGRAARVTFTIDGDGFFGDPRATGDKAIAGCLASATRGVGRLARRPDTGEVVVTYELKTEAP